MKWKTELEVGRKERRRKRVREEAKIAREREGGV